MDPNHDTLPGVNLPSPQGEATMHESAAVPVQSPEIQAPALPVAQATPPVLPPSMPSPQMPALSATLPTSNAVSPAVAEDNDLIEKEWVIKAKQIVDNTRYDPYEQTKQIGKFKADYMKKRYNKIIDSTDD